MGPVGGDVAVDDGADPDDAPAVGAIGAGATGAGTDATGAGTGAGTLEPGGPAGGPEPSRGSVTARLHLDLREHLLQHVGVLGGRERVLGIDDSILQVA